MIQLELGRHILGLHDFQGPGCRNRIITRREYAAAAGHLLLQMQKRRGLLVYAADPRIEDHSRTDSHKAPSLSAPGLPAQRDDFVEYFCRDLEDLG